MLIWQAHKGRVDSAAFSADGKCLATISGSTRAVYLWEPTTGKLVRKLSAGSELVDSIAFAPDAPLLAAGRERGVTIWRTGTWEVLAELDQRELYHVREVVFGRGPRPLFAASTVNRVSVWKDA